MLTYIRNFNDLHLDFDLLAGKVMKRQQPKWWTPPPLATDPHTALVIAGDLGTALNHGGEWLAEVAPRFHSVVLVRGNHDFWGGLLDDPALPQYIEEHNLKNVYLLQNSWVFIDGVRFMGGTFWTNFKNEDPISLMHHPMEMAHDLDKIKVGQYGQLSTMRVLIEHRVTRDYIFKNAAKRPGERALVVVTHHAPSEQSIAADRAHTPLQNTYYYSEYGNEIAYSEIDLWFHGHTHNSVDYKIYNTRVINNPRGYYCHNENYGFDQYSLITLPD